MALVTSGEYVSSIPSGQRYYQSAELILDFIISPGPD